MDSLARTDAAILEARAEDAGPDPDPKGKAPPPPAGEKRGASTGGAGETEGSSLGDVVLPAQSGYPPDDNKGSRSTSVDGAGV